MIIISAMSRDRVIGSGEGMPWNVPEEYQQFLSFVEDQTVIMGRRSYEIFGPDLTSAHTVVVSRWRDDLRADGSSGRGDVHLLHQGGFCGRHLLPGVRRKRLGGG